MSMIKAIFFDVGETLVDETRAWTEWAAWLDVPAFTFFGVLGSLIERGEHHKKVFEILRPDIDLNTEKELGRKAGKNFTNSIEDLYPDALPALQSLKKHGYLIGLSGNQPSETEKFLNTIGIEADFVASSQSWGVEKPSLDFFNRITELTKLRPEQVAYVGDRLDNDILPAIEIGMIGVFIKRGPWGYIHSRHPEVQKVKYQINSLDEVLGIVQNIT